ncbi:formin-like protein 5 [Gigaspora margarita]|uniref:Formin-like protein 5 n=1 Tax=Gigaspora margarita TaxID=4874 RepID=A0A8H4ER64_GIGMA|nr:formin-like protein 5 [Gigaspora margarita]
MVKKKSGRTLNPADAHRKAMRQKEIKKNKMERKRVRTLVMVHKDTSKLEEEISRYKALDKEKRLDKNGKAKLKDLEDKLSKILDTKKAHGVSVHREKPKDHIPVYFHPTLNPSGTLMPSTSKGKAQDDEESSGNEDSDNEYSDDDRSSEGSEKRNKQESDEDIPLPPGKPPSNESDDELPELPPGTPPKQKDSDDDLPELPPGPPPSLQNNDNNTQSSGISRSPPFGFRPLSMPAGPQYPPPQSTYMMFNNPPGSSNHLRPPPNVRPPPPPVFTSGTANIFSRPPPIPVMSGQGTPLRPSDSRPPPFSSQVSHYGPPPPPVQPVQPVVQPVQPVQGINKVTRATPVIQAEPQVRNLQKELTTLVPAALLRKKADARKPKVARPVVNAAPNIDDGIGTSTSSVKRKASIAIPLLQQQTDYDVQASEPKQTVVNTPSPAKKSKTKKKVDEYDKFMAEMQDLL